jgi:phosphotransacetylase
LQKRKKKKLADKFLKRIDEMWAPLREVQAENKAAELRYGMSVYLGECDFVVCG